MGSNDVPDDLTQLSTLDNESVLRGVEARYQQNKIYTSIASLLVAVNPYEWLDIYGEEKMAMYKNDGEALPPHAYRTASTAHAGLLRGVSQSIVISGESGAGKSETAKKVLQQLAFCSATGGAESGIESRILASSPVLEAFGNAKTPMNDNSSRFGKFIQLIFDAHSAIMGARINTYLLEKPRVCGGGMGERGYHIGYMLCQDASLSAELGLPAAKDLAYLGRTGCLTSPGWDDAHELQLSTEALDKVGLEPDQTKQLWKLVAAVLLLGQLEFGDGSDAVVADRVLLEQISSLVGADADRMGTALTTKTTKVGGEFIASPVPPSKASELRDALARSMYASAFDWVVAAINKSLCTSEQAVTGRFSGILDIFGFETFEAGNSLEQLCINFCNERLQATFNQSTFEAQAAENAAEGIELPEADLSEIDNTAVVSLIAGKGIGIFATLDEECVVPGGSDAGMLTKLFEKNGISARASQADPKAVLSRPAKVRDSFTVRHFVGPVTYSAVGFLEKNKDPVSEDLLAVLERSESTFIQQVFVPKSETTELLKPKRGGKAFSGVASKFTKQLTELLDLINSSDMHFVRCIKPNKQKKPLVFEEQLVHNQLLCSGVFEAVRVIGMGYPDRLPHKVILHQFAMLLDEVTRQGAPAGDQPAAAFFLEALGLEPNGATPDFCVGKTKVFFKANVVSGLRRRHGELQSRKAFVVSAAARGMMARRLVKRIRAAIRVQASERVRIARRVAADRLRKAIELQAAARGMLAKLELAALRRARAALGIQRQARILLARRQLAERRRAQAVTRLQARARVMISRAHVAKLHALAAQEEAEREALAAIEAAAAAAAEAAQEAREVAAAATEKAEAGIEASADVIHDLIARAPAVASQLEDAAAMLTDGPAEVAVEKADAAAVAAEMAELEAMTVPTMANVEDVAHSFHAVHRCAEQLKTCMQAKQRLDAQAQAAAAKERAATEAVHQAYALAEAHDADVALAAVARAVAAKAIARAIRIVEQPFADEEREEGEEPSVSLDAAFGSMADLDADGLAPLASAEKASELEFVERSLSTREHEEPPSELEMHSVAQEVLHLRSVSRKHSFRGESAALEASEASGLGHEGSMVELDESPIAPLLQGEETPEMGQVKSMWGATTAQDRSKLAKASRRAKQFFQDVGSYACYLGMDPIEDEELLWVAAAALKAPLPEEWEERMDTFGELYYVHTTTGRETRQHPLDGYYANVYREQKAQQGTRQLRAKVRRDLYMGEAIPINLADKNDDGNVAMDNATIGKLLDQYEALDRNGDGHLDCDEWTAMMKSQYGLSEHEARRAYDAWDIDNSGTICFDEFVAMMGPVAQVQSELIEASVAKLGLDASEAKKLRAQKRRAAMLAVPTFGLSYLPYKRYKRTLANRAAREMERAQASNLLAVKSKLLAGPTPTEAEVVRKSMVSSATSLSAPSTSLSAAETERSISPISVRTDSKRLSL